MHREISSKVRLGKNAGLTYISLPVFTSKILKESMLVFFAFISENGSNVTFL